MNIVFFVIGLVVGLATGWVLWHKGSNLSAANAALQARKEAEKAKVLQLFSSTKQEITNNDVEHSLSVSNATATNYLTELEAEGKLVQLGGEDGRAVRYRLNA